VPQAHQVSVRPDGDTAQVGPAIPPGIRMADRLPVDGDPVDDDRLARIAAADETSDAV
jgi:hypothetical protein